MDGLQRTDDAGGISDPVAQSQAAEATADRLQRERLRELALVIAECLPVATRVERTAEAVYQSARDFSENLRRIAARIAAHEAQEAENGAG